MMLKLLAVLSLLTLALERAAANEFRYRFDKADVVVVASAGTSTSGFASTYNVRSIPISKLELRVLRYIKGSGEPTLSIALPVSESGDLPQYAKPGAIALWFLQRPISPEGFLFDRGSPTPAMPLWEMKGFDLAPLCLDMGERSVIPLITARCQSSLPPFIMVCDLFARNAAASKLCRYAYLDLLRRCSPIDRTAEGWPGFNWSGDQLALKSWLKEQYGKIYAPSTDDDRLNDTALRLHWGQMELEKPFVDLLLRLAPDRLRFPAPPGLGFETHLFLAERSPAKHAAVWFDFLKDGPRAIRRKVLLAAVKRIGESKSQDASILICIATLYKRDDLYPSYKERSAPQGLAKKVHALKALAKKEYTSNKEEPNKSPKYLLIWRPYLSI